MSVPAKAFIEVPAVPLLEMTSIELLAWAAEQAPDQIAVKQPFEGFGEEIVWTYSEYLADARRIASYLSTFYSFGDHVAIWATNSGPWLLYEFAAAHLGLVLVTMNPASRPAELDYMLTKSRAKGIIMDRSYRGQDLVQAVADLRGRLPDLAHIHYLDEWRDQVEQGSDDIAPSTTRPDDPGLIVFTSGTTGKPKAAILHHRGIVNNPKIATERLGLAPKTIWLASLPTFHVGGTVTMSMGAVSNLGTQIIMPAFQPEIILRLIEKERINYSALVPAMVAGLVEHPDFKTTDLSSFHHLQVGGTVITPAFVKLVRQELGCDVQVVLGQTECCAEITKTLRGDPDEAIEETVGVPFPGTSLKISDPVTGETKNIGEVGEIRLLSPYATYGYFGDPEATEALFDEDGFLRTGDLGSIDENGRLRMNGRLKEVIIRGGENIYPREVEDAIAEYPGISECAVFAVPHPRWGEEVAAALRLNAPGVEPADVREFLLLQLARHKVPKHWMIVEEFPRNTSGKVQKFELQRLFAERAEKNADRTG
ncbi:fatty-acyl-CoA synthase [Sphingopyxis sp. YR583]|nr:fatty-acyl-CoA synthase [Sphingopyxis sp. YR583]